MITDGDVPDEQTWGAAAPSIAGIPLARPILIPTSLPSPVLGDPFFLADYRRRDAWMDIGVVIVALVLFELLVGFLVGLATESAINAMEPDNEGLPAELSRSLQVPLLTVRASVTVALIVWIARRRGLTWASIGLRRSPLWLDLAIGLAATLAIYGVMGIVQLMIFFFFPEMLEQLSENASRLMALIPKLHPVVFIPFSLMVGIYEELLFRGFLMTRLRRAFGGWTWAVLLSTAVFTLLHVPDQTPLALAAITVLSLMFSMLTIWRRSIVAAIWAHALFDWSQFTLMYYTAGDAWQ